jgi:acetate---CoA ligase (ADP-forming)
MLEMTMTLEEIAGLHRVLDPPAATIIGFSPDSRPSLGILEGIQRGGYKGPIHLVNVRRHQAGESGYLESVRDIDGDFGLVYVLLSGQAALDAVLSIQSRPVGVVIYGGGFADSGAIALEERLSDWASTRFPGPRVPVLGPQSMGVFSSTSGFFGTNSPIPEPILPGGVGLVSQSGGLMGTLARALTTRRIGLESGIAVGNGRTTSVFESIIALLYRDSVNLVIGYVEDASNLELLSQVGEVSRQRGKPVLLAAGGASEVGAAAASSHTGALATPERLLRGVSRQFGVLLVRSPEELIWGAEALLDNDLRNPRSPRLAVIGFTGGGAIAVADELSRDGTDLKPPSSATTRMVLSLGAEHSSVLNPFDGGASATNPSTVKAIIDAYLTDGLYGVYIYIAGAGLPPPSENHRRQLEIFAGSIREAGTVGIVASVAPDGQSGAWSIDGVTTARGSHESAVKARVLRDWANTTIRWRDS